jgi:hypothetical protein
MYDLLPQNVLTKIYEYDFTYRHIFNLCLLELELNFHHKKCLSEVILKFTREKMIYHYFINQHINNIFV